MNTRTESEKLLELRAKTDRQLVTFITNRLDSGLRMASLDTRRTEAEKVRDEVSVLLPWVCDVTVTERRLLEVKLAHLREMLIEFSSDAQLAACS